MIIRKLVAIAKGYFFHGSTQVPDVSVWDDEPSSGNMLAALYQNGKAYLKERLGIGINPPVYRLHVVVNQDDRIAIVQSAEQAFGVWIEKAVGGGASNCQWQVMVPLGDTSLQLVKDGTVRMKLLGTSGHIEMPAGVFKMSTLVADRPLKLDSSGYMTDGKIKLNDANEVQGAVQVANGGTGATDAAGARTNLGLTGTDSLTLNDLTLNALTASRPVRTDANKKLVSGAIDLSALNEVTSGSMTNGQVASWNGSYLIGLNIGTGASDVAAGNHTHSGYMTTGGGPATAGSFTTNDGKTVSYNTDGRITNVV